MKNRNIVLEELKKYRFAHRGLHDKPEVPENSLLAFERACERGFGIEFDVHLTKNGKLAVMHDSGLKRVTTVRSDHLPVIPENAHIECTTTFRTAMIIEEITLEEAKKYPLEESDERIPELKEVLDLVAGRVPVIVELKPREGNHEELVKKVMEEVDEYCSPDFSVLRLSSLAGYKPKDISEVIHEYYNCNFNAFLNEYRIREACRRVSEDEAFTRLTIQGMANSVGFKSRSAFIAAFKKFAGLTPSEYIKISVQTKAEEKQL